MSKGKRGSVWNNAILWARKSVHVVSITRAIGATGILWIERARGETNKSDPKCSVWRQRVKEGLLFQTKRKAVMARTKVVLWSERSG